MINIASSHSSFHICNPKRQCRYSPPVSFGAAEKSENYTTDTNSSVSKLKDITKNIDSFLNQLKTRCVYGFPNKYTTELTLKGTVLGNAEPLADFWKTVKDVPQNQLVSKGLSTNTVGDSYALLKSTEDNPLSTSFVQNCSVIYLYNEKTKTHFLYHMYPHMPIDSLEKTIKIFVPEGYTKACIVPGNNYYEEQHKQYLPEVIDMIKNNNPNADIKTFCSQTEHPEIVGYKGNVYEIENKNWKNGKLGQASFRVSGFTSYDIFYSIDACKNEQDVAALKEFYKILNIDKTLYVIIEELLNERSKDFSKPFFSDMYLED